MILNGCWVAARYQELCYFGVFSFFDLCCSCSSISYQLSERKQLSAIMKDGRMKVVIDVLEIIHLYPLKWGDHCFHRFFVWEDLCTSTVSKLLPCTPGAGSRSANNSNVVTAWMATGRIYCSLPWLGGDYRWPYVKKLPWKTSMATWCHMTEIQAAKKWS